MGFPSLGEGLGVGFPSLGEGSGVGFPSLGEVLGVGQIRLNILIAPTAYRKHYHVVLLEGEL